MKKVIFPVLLGLMVFAVFFAFVFVKNQSEAVSKTDDFSQVVEFEVEKGMTAKAAGIELKKLGLIRNSDLFYCFARFPKIGSFVTAKSENIFRIQTGFYELSPSMNLGEIFAELCTGKEKAVVVSIPEGFTVSKVAEKLKAAGLKNAEDFEQVALHDGKKIFKAHGLNVDAESVEGFLYPDTYSIPLSYNSEKIIGLMIDNLLKNLQLYSETSGIQNKADFYKTIILASIVEREYRSKEEAASIAGVFVNRLSINMPLQSCATVEYIITEINHKPHPKIIYFADLESKSPYNTYKYPGLPPGPISNPGITALKAAASPEKNDYLYFTLTDTENWKHTFSKDLGSHNKATYEFRTKRVN